MPRANLTRVILTVCAVAACIAAAPAAIPAEPAGSFDELIALGDPDGAVPFKQRFAAAAAAHFDERDAFKDFASADRARHDRGAALLRIGIARHVTYARDSVRVDEPASEISYIVRCGPGTVTLLNHHTQSMRDVQRQFAGRRSLVFALAQGDVNTRVRSGLKRQANAQFEAHGDLNSYVLTITVQRTAPSTAADGTQASRFAYHYDIPIAAPACRLLDDGGFIMWGEYGPKSALSYYESLYGFFNVGIERSVAPSPTAAFSSLDFAFESTSSTTYTGTVVRSNVSTTPPPVDTFDVPKNYIKL